MAYITEADVVREVRGLEVNADTAVKTDDIAAWIVQAEAYINGRLSVYYITPIPAGEGQEIVRMIAIYKVAHRVKMKLELNEQNSDKKQEVQGNLDSKAEKMLDQIAPKVEGKAVVDPVLKLPGATLISRSPDDQALTSYNKNNSATFIKNGNNW